MKFYDVNCDGNIGYEEFIRGLREPLSQRRSNMVEAAFKLMDKDNSGKLTTADISQVFDVTNNQDFQEGTKTKEEILADFLNSFDGMRGNSDGTITHQEWTDYYTDLSMSVPSDEYFVRMMESVWCIAEDGSSTVTKQEVEALTQALRHKLLDFSKNSQDEYILRQVFKEFDANGNGVLTVDELANMFARLQMSVERKYLQALLNKFDRNGNGVIEFEEFCEFLIHNNFK